MFLWTGCLTRQLKPQVRTPKAKQTPVDPLWPTGVLYFWQYQMTGQEACPTTYVVGCAFFEPRDSLYFFSKRSMRPAVSMSFWRPV